MEKIDCRGCLEEDIAELCLEYDIRKFRANQIFHGVQQKGAQNWEEINNIGNEDREKLKQILFIQAADLVREQISRDGTRKFLFGLADKERIETVLMDYEKDISRERHTLCVSTQVGCPVGCSFCATGMDGFRRNLSVGEITGQVLDVMRHMQKEDPDFKITNIVFMGMGEPFLNYDSVLKAITILNDENGQNIGMRRMTVSTSGVVPRIIQLAGDNPQVGLAVSLHSAKDAVRDILVPMNRRYPLAKLIEACNVYSKITNRRVTFEVALNDENAEKGEAHDLVRMLQGMLVHVNLIPINPVVGSRVRRPGKEKILMFKRILEAGNIPVSVREEKGLDIDAACGQLRQHLESEEHETVDQI